MGLAPSFLEGFLHFISNVTISINILILIPHPVTQSTDLSISCVFHVAIRTEDCAKREVEPCVQPGCQQEKLDCNFQLKTIHTFKPLTTFLTSIQCSPEAVHLPEGNTITLRSGKTLGPAHGAIALNDLHLEDSVQNLLDDTDSSTQPGGICFTVESIFV